MSGTTTPSYSNIAGQVKTLAVRIPEDVRAQLDIIASLNDRTVTDEIRLAIIDWIDKTKASPDLQQRAASVRAEIEREAPTKQGAIPAIFGAKPTTAARTARRGEE